MKTFQLTSGCLINKERGERECTIPFTATTEIQHSLLWYSFSNVNVIAQTSHTHVCRVWFNQRSTFTTHAVNNIEHINTTWHIIYHQLGPKITITVFDPVISDVQKSQMCPYRTSCCAVVSFILCKFDTCCS